MAGEEHVWTDGERLNDVLFKLATALGYPANDLGIVYIDDVEAMVEDAAEIIRSYGVVFGTS